MENQVVQIDTHIDQHAATKTSKVNLNSAWVIAKPILQFLETTILALRPKWQIAVKDLITAIDDQLAIPAQV